MRKRICYRAGRTAMGGCIAMFLVACASKLTESNFTKIQDGMTREEVVAILGEPTDSGSVGFGGFSGGMATWKDDAGTIISVQFVNDKVAGKQFSKSSEGGSDGP